MHRNTAEVDAETIDSILRAMYEVLSGPSGRARDWGRFRSLFIDSARLMPIVSDGGRVSIRNLSVEDYIRRVEAIFETEDFWERETNRKTERIGNFAHVLSAYESLRNPEGPAFEHGANSMQLFYDGKRWWIVSSIWNTSRKK